MKSPPELWAELSDQDSLARHLSEFGEIRITSTVAESAVHWEGEEATGSALIKQAGWGTKVTLRATVASTEPEPERAALLPALHTAPPTPDSALAAATLVPASATASPSATTAAPAAPAPASPPAGPGPLTAAGLRDSVEPSPPPERVTPIRSPRPVEAPTPPAPKPLPAAARTANADPAHEAVADSGASVRDAPEEESPPPTRRGFFARLFGRRARGQGERDRAPIDDGPAAGADAGQAGVGERPAETDEPPADADAGASSEPIQPTALEALQARFGVRPPAPESPPVLQEPAVAEIPVRTEPVLAEAPAATSDPPSEEPGRSIAAADASEQATGKDLSSELRQAEEIGAGDVTAAPTEDEVKEILTGVLDRLGAAHHRPFSRA